MFLPQKTFQKLKSRIGEKHLLKRLKRQASYLSKHSNKGRINFYWHILPIALRLFLSLFRLQRIATNSTIDYKIEEIDVYLCNLPESFSGFSILHLSDLHIDNMLDHGNRLRDLVGGINCGLCVITGDFRYDTFDDYHETIIKTKELVDAIHCKEGVLGTLGNYDVVELVLELEAVGVRMLMNESISIRRGDDLIWILGLDDPTLYKTHNLEKAMQGVPETDSRILLAHSPDVIKMAANRGIDYYMCGHTHGGQICLPGGHAIRKNSQCTRKYVSGSWKYKGMAGYTSRGVGFSCLPIRLFCQPEITIHRLFPLKKSNQ